MIITCDEEPSVLLLSKYSALFAKPAKQLLFIISTTAPSLFTEILFFLYMFLANQQFISHNFLLCHPSQRSAHSQVPSHMATHKKIGSQLWAGEMPDSNLGLQDNSQARYH